jgi:hypothetical protein
MAIAIPIGHVCPHILDHSISSMLLDVVVDPSDQNLLVAQFL